MKTVLCLICAITTWLFWSMDRRPGDRPDAPRDQFEIKIRLSKAAFQPSESILLSCEHRNLAGSPKTIYLSGFWPNHSVMVTNENGEEPPLTQKGKACRAVFRSLRRDKNAPLVLKAGESHTAADIDIAEIYVLSPGHYKVTVTYDDEQKPTPLKAISLPAVFEVERSKPAGS